MVKGGVFVRQRTYLCAAIAFNGYCEVRVQ
jgi:hypothetical protein